MNTGDNSGLAAVAAATRLTVAELTPASLRELRPDLVRSIEAAHDVSQLLSTTSAAALSAGRSEGAAEGARAERTRVLGIQAAAFAGQEALAKEMIDDGKTSPGEAALRFN